MNEVEKRRKRLSEVLARGVGNSMPQSVHRDIEVDVPSRTTMDWSWWSHVWPRPTEAALPQERAYENLDPARASWDRSHQLVQASLEREAERETRKAEHQAALAAEEEAIKKAHEADLTERLRRVYLKQPGTTEETFQRALPELLEQRARAVALGGPVDPESPMGPDEILRIA